MKKFNKSDKSGEGDRWDKEGKAGGGYEEYIKKGPKSKRRDDGDNRDDMEKKGKKERRRDKFGGKNRDKDKGIVKKFNGITMFSGKIATRNKTPGYRVYDEKLIEQNNSEFRIWDPYRSKLGAAIMKGLKSFPINRNSKVLYLGASSGTTASHVADIAESVYCVEFSKRMMRELLHVTMKKNNMIPVLGDAKRPDEYLHNIGGVDVIFQDVAQRNQAEILIKNTKVFSPRYAMLSIKSRSISASKTPKQVFREEIEKLKEKFEVLEIIDLRPYEKDHVLVNLEVK